MIQGLTNNSKRAKIDTIHYMIKKITKLVLIFNK